MNKYRVTFRNQKGNIVIEIKAENFKQALFRAASRAREKGHTDFEWISSYLLK